MPEGANPVQPQSQPRQPVQPERRYNHAAPLATGLVLLLLFVLGMLGWIAFKEAGHQNERDWMIMPAGQQQMMAASAASSSGSGAAAAAAAPAGAQHVHLVVDPPPLYGVKNPHGAVVDAFVPADFTVHAGKPVVVTVLNYDSMPHTWTAGGLGVNEMVPAGGPHSPTKVTFTFTPKSAGTFTWQCEAPCNPWSMAHMGYMEGTVTVTA